MDAFTLSSETTDYEDYLSPPSNVEECNTIKISNFGKNVLPTFYYIILTVSILGNGLVLLVVFKFEKLNTVTNIFLLNLVASNALFTLTLPFQAIYHSKEWVFGVALCKIVHCADFLGFYSCILFLTLMTFDRYLAVVHCVVANKQRSTHYAISLSVAVWVFSFLCSLEPLLHFTVEKSQMHGLTCSNTEGKWKNFSLYKQLTIFFFFPLSVFIYCYSCIIHTVLATRMIGKHRTVRLVFVIVLLFFLCWSPYNILLMIKDAHNCKNSIEYALYITSNIAHFYFCINPLFYTFLGIKFRNHVRRALKSRVSCLTNSINISSTSQTKA